MTRLQKIIVLVAGCLIALRLFVPVQACTYARGALQYTVTLPYWVPWDYDYTSDRYVETLPPDSPEGTTATKVVRVPEGRFVTVYAPNPNGTTAPDTSTWVKTRQGWGKDVPTPNPTPPPVYRWIIHVHNKRPPLWKQIITLDPGGYLVTSCSTTWESYMGYAISLPFRERHFYAATLLHALGIATLAGMLLLVAQPSKGKAGQ